MRHFMHALRHPRDYEWLELRPFQHHSRVLLVAGFVYMIFGASVALTHPSHDRVSALRFALKIMPLEGWGSVWMIVGWLALLSSRWPPASKTWGYSLLSAISAFWAAAYFVGWAFLGGPMGGLTGTFVWGLVTFLWWAISKLENPDDLLELVSAELRAGNPDSTEE